MLKKDPAELRCTFDVGESTIRSIKNNVESIRSFNALNIAKVTIRVRNLLLEKMEKIYDGLIQDESEAEGLITSNFSFSTILLYIGLKKPLASEKLPK